MLRVLAFLVASAAAAAAIAAHGGWVDARLDLLAHATPIWFAAGVGALLLWAASMRRGRAVPVLALLAMFASGALMVPELLSPRPRFPAGDGAVKVVQFNIWGRNDRWAAAVRWLLNEDPDVIVMEEMRRGRRMLPALAARYPYVTTCAHPAPCDTVIFSKRRPLSQGGLEDGSQPFLSAAWATLPARGGPVTVVAAHYTRPNDPDLIQAQSARLAGLLHDLPRERIIVAGDFNLTPWSHLLRKQDRAFGLQRVTRALPSWPGGWVSSLRLWAPVPVMPIDHVYAGPGWQVVSVERGPKLGSDHYPIVVTLTPAPLSPSTAGR